MSQNGQAAVLKCSPIWKKMWKSFKTLSELKAQVYSQNLETESYGYISWKRNPAFHMEKELK